MDQLQPEMGLHPREMVVGKLGQEGILTLPKMLSLQQEGIKLDKGKLGTMALKIEGALRAFERKELELDQ